MADRNWGPIASAMWSSSKKWGGWWLLLAYTVTFFILLIGAAVMLSIMVSNNQESILLIDPALRLKNYGVTFVALVLLFLVGLVPHLLAVIAISGAVTGGGMPDFSWREILTKGTEGIPNFELQKFIGVGWKTILGWVQGLSHVALFIVLVGSVFSTLPVHQPAAVLGVFITLFGLGLAVVLLATEKKWYKRCVFTILLVSLLLGLYGGLSYTPPQDKLAEKANEILKGMENNKKAEEVTSIIARINIGTETQQDRHRIQELQNEQKTPGSSIKSGFKASVKEVKTWFTDEWRVVQSIDCEVANAPGGWCSAGVQPAGTYRVVVKYDKVGLQQQDMKIHEIPTRGIHILDLWGNSPEFVEVFQKNAPVKNLRIAGLVGRSAEGKTFDPTTEEGRFEQEVSGPVSFSVNLPQHEPFYRQVRGSIKVDLEKLVE